MELFEARKPKGLAKIAEVGGVVSIEETDKALTVVVTDEGGDEHRNSFPRRTRLFVAEGEQVEPGTQLNEGSLYPHELLAIRGRTETELYLVKEVQEVYKSQGVDIDDKHIELIVRQMMKKVRVDQKGDTEYLPGAFIDRNVFLARNEQVGAEGGEQAQFEEIILGITKASLNTDSFLSAASFQETTKVLTDAALEGKKDSLHGLNDPWWAALAAWVSHCRTGGLAGGRSRGLTGCTRSSGCRAQIGCRPESFASARRGGRPVE